MVKRKPTLLSNEDIEFYNWEETRLNVRSFFSKYRSYISKVKVIKERYNTSLSDDNLGVFSSSISNPTANKVEQMDKYNCYIKDIDKHLNKIKESMTQDEKIILKYSVLDNFTDEGLSELLSIIRPHIYGRKKSCYIKVARYFDLEVERDTL